MCGTCNGNQKKCCGGMKKTNQFMDRELNPAYNTPLVIFQSPLNAGMRANVPTSYTRVVPQQGYSNAWATSEVAEQRLNYQHIRKNVAPIQARIPPINKEDLRHAE